MAQTPPGSPIQLAQEWNLVPVDGGGAVQLINRASSLALNVANGPSGQNPRGHVRREPAVESHADPLKSQEGEGLHPSPIAKKETTMPSKTPTS